MGHAAEAVQHGHGGHDGHEAWGTSVWPFVISFGVLALAAAFMFQFVYHKPFAAVIALGLGIPMILGGVAGWVSEAMGHGEGLSAPWVGSSSPKP